MVRLPMMSVVVPAYNEAALLPQTLRALTSQDYAGPFEIIVVDNNSTDATAAVARSYPGVRVVFEPEPGVCQARQGGTAAARGEIVVSTDADTVQESGWLSRIAGHFSDPGVVCVAGPCRYASPSWWAVAYPRLLFGMVGVVRRLTGRVCYVTATNTAFRRTAFEGYDLRLTQGGDELDLLRRMRHHGRVVWDPGNVVLTSARRLRRGLLYSLVVTFVGYYLLGYLLNRVFGRTLLGMAPPVRDNELGPGTTPARAAPAGVPALDASPVDAAPVDAVPVDAVSAVTPATGVTAIGPPRPGSPARRRATVILRQVPLRIAAAGVALILIAAGLHRVVFAFLHRLPVHLLPRLHLNLPMAPW